MDAPGYCFIMENVSGVNYEIEIESEANPNGSFWINPSLVDIKIDLNSTVEWKSDYDKVEGHELNLTYVIDNAEKNATFIFKYHNLLNRGGQNLNIPNPFVVCHGNDCKDNIVTYDFKEGESYQIYVKYRKIHYDIQDFYFFPSFSFYDKTKEKESNSFYIAFNLWTICLLLFLL